VDRGVCPGERLKDVARCCDEQGIAHAELEVVYVDASSRREHMGRNCSRLGFVAAPVGDE
jgi:hypothetical protein